MLSLNGRIVFQYFYDCGGEINLDKIPREKLGMTEYSFTRGARILAPKYEEIGLLPLETGLGTVEVDGHRIEVGARIFPIGVIGIYFTLTLDGADVDQTIRLVGLDERKVRVNGKEIEFGDLARSYFEDLKKRIKGAIYFPYKEFRRPETYTLVLVTSSEPKLSTRDFFGKFRKQIAGLLRGEIDWRSLSRKEVEDALRVFLTYSDKDIIFVDWYSTLIYGGEDYMSDFVRMIELAKIQLLELKTFDHLLDLRVDRAYDFLRTAFAGRIGVGLRSRSYRELVRTASELAELRVEVMDYVGDLRNILKFTGEWYLGKIYRVASERFRISDWLALVDKKLDQLQELYAMAMERVDAQHAKTLEFLMTLLMIAIVVLEVIMVLE